VDRSWDRDPTLGREQLDLPTELVQPRPRGALPQAEHALKTERGHAVLLIDDIAARSELQRQRRERRGEDRAGY
jgi:hypothetical protein